jgi:hypothetical protein
MEDKQLTCKDCGQTFTFTANEQAFYKEKGFDNEPQRCPGCRKIRKAERSNFPRRNSGYNNPNNRRAA